MNKIFTKDKMLPFILAAVVIIIDQVTKALVVHYILPYTVGASFFGDFIRLIHVSNTGVAFSVGESLPTLARRLMFAVVPLAIIVLVLVVYFRNDTFNKLQRWCICGICGGGIGNLIDRFVRAEGVVDFIDVKFYGIFGLKRWPTFNCADSAVVICGIILIISFIISIAKDKDK